MPQTLMFAPPAAAAQEGDGKDPLAHAALPVVEPHPHLAARVLADVASLHRPGHAFGRQRGGPPGVLAGKGGADRQNEDEQAERQRAVEPPRCHDSIV